MHFQIYFSIKTTLGGKMGKFYAFLEIQTPLHANKTTEIEMNAMNKECNKIEI